jgi:hypothetical protein
MLKANAVGLNDPQLTNWASALHGGDNPAHIFDGGWLFLGFEPEHAIRAEMGCP